MVEIKKMVKSSIVKKVLQINCTCDIYIPMGDLGMLKHRESLIEKLIEKSTLNIIKRSSASTLYADTAKE